MIAAAQALRNLGASRIVAAVPVAARETCDSMRTVVDEMVCALTPEPFYAVGLWYEEFEQTSDEEVKALLERARARKSRAVQRGGEHDDDWV